MTYSLAAGCVLSGIILRYSTRPWKGSAGYYTQMGRDFTLTEYIQVGIWGGAIGMTTLLLLLLCTLRWWWPYTEAAQGVVPELTAHPRLRWEWPVLLGVLLVAGGMRYPMLDMGIRWDEHDNLRRSYHGLMDYDRTPRREPWVPADFREAFFENERSNNPLLYSVCAQLSLRTWRAITGADRTLFNVTAMRVPAFLAGMGGIVLAWVLARRLGGALPAVLAAALLAVHPLHIRYSVEARSYSLVLLLAPLILLSGLRVLETGRWRWAFAVSASAALIIHAFLGAGYYAMMAAVGLIVVLWRSRQPGAWATFARLCVAGGIVLGVLLWLMAPGLLQARKSLADIFDQGGLPFVSFVQIWDWMVVGVNLPGDHAFFELRDGKLGWLDYALQLLQREPVTLLMAWLFIPWLTYKGALQLLRQQGVVGWFLLITICVAPLACLFHHAFITHFGIYQWYVIYGMPGHFVLLALACHQLGGQRSQWLCLGVLGLFLLASHSRYHGHLATYQLWDVDHGLPTAHSVFKRGPNLYETWADGRVNRQRRPDKVDSTAPKKP
jgi:hypothetical protein